MEPALQALEQGKITEPDQRGSSSSRTSRSRAPTNQRSGLQRARSRNARGRWRSEPRAPPAPATPVRQRLPTQPDGEDPNP